MAWVPDNAPKTVHLSTRAHCDECHYANLAMLRKVQGVYSLTINADRNTITIGGTAAPKELLETLLKVYQNGEYCVKPPAHVPPSSCPSNPPNNFALRTCPTTQGGCCSTATTNPRCCACTGRGRSAAACCYPHNYYGHGRF